MSLQRNLYLASRLAGDARALQRGRLGERVAGRIVRRYVICLLRSPGLW